MDKRDEFDMDFDFEKEYGFDPSLMDNNYDEEPDFLSMQHPADSIPEAPQNYVEDASSYGDMFQAPSYDEDPAPYYDAQPEEPIPYYDARPEEPVYDEAQQPEYDPEPVQDERPQPIRRRREKRSRRIINPFASKPAAKPEPPAPVKEETVYFDESEPEYTPVALPMTPSEVLSAVAPESFADVPAETEPEFPNESAPEAPRPGPRRRRKPTKQQIFKEVHLPRIIAGSALLLILIMVVGSIVRAVGGGDGGKMTNSERAEQQAELDAEAATLMEQAADLAAGYDYNAAITLLDSFSGEQSAYPDMLTARSTYAKAQENLIEWRDPSAVPNLSFHVLIADPAKAFTDESLGKKYNQNFVTTDEFEKILQQLYEKDYVLVGLEDVVFSTTADGKTTYSANTIYLPDGKKPIMITETMVNYYGYMVESGGFASKLVLDDKGNVTAEMVDASGKTVRGNYDLVPILNAFIEEHPDFSYKGARAILAVSGYEGVFGYRTKNGGEEAESAQKVIEALRKDGYTIACYSYADINYSKASATEIQADLQKWSAEITPILGNVDVLVYAKGTDITDYPGNQYNVLYNAGFRYFIGTGTIASAKVAGDYFHQRRIMVTGTQMAHGSTLYAPYFNAMAVLNSTRGNVPQ